MLREKSMMTTKRRKTMSTKSKTQIRKAHPVVNNVFFGLTDKEGQYNPEIGALICGAAPLPFPI